MQDVELYQHLIGLNPPWFVSKVDVDPKKLQIDVWVEHQPEVRFPCPECSQEEGVYDHSDERVWRHLDSCHFKTLVHARPPRIQCVQHGTRQILLPWAGPKSRFTLLFECLAIDVLLECNVSAAGGILDVSWDEAWGILHRAVERGLRAKQARVYQYLGVDEKAIAKRHKYFTIVCDLAQGTVEYVTEDRKQESLDTFFKTLTPEQLAGIEGIAMDMWDPFFKSVMNHVPGAADKIVFDRFHIMQHMGRAVDKVRKWEHVQLRSVGDNSLTRTKYLWLTSRENLSDQQRERFEDVRQLNLKTGRAWAIKESLRDLWAQSDSQAGTDFWKKWYWWGTHSRLEPVRQVAHTVKRHIANVLTYFRHPITNAVCEGVNSKIQTIKQMAKGFRNKENFKAAIYFRCGGLSLYPTHGEAG